MIIKKCRCWVDFRVHFHPDEPSESGGSVIVTCALCEVLPDLLDTCKFALSVLKANPIELSECMAIEKLEAVIQKAENNSAELEKEVQAVLARRAKLAQRPRPY